MSRSATFWLFDESVDFPFARGTVLDKPPDFITPLRQPTWSTFAVVSGPPNVCIQAHQVRNKYFVTILEGHMWMGRASLGGGKVMVAEFLTK